jgi:hypothetical protein
MSVAERIRERRAEERTNDAQIGVEQTSRALWMHARDLKAMRADTPQHFDCIVMDDIVQAHKVMTDIINGVE